MHVLTLSLKTSKSDKHILNRRFYAAYKIHNIYVKHAKKQLTNLSRNKQYQTCLKEYRNLLKKDKLSKEDKQRKSELSKQMKDIVTIYGLTKNEFRKYSKKLNHKYKKLLSSQQTQKEAERVFNSVEKYLYDNGKQVHYKKFEDITTVSCTSNKNGIKFDKETMSAIWLGLELKVKLPKGKNKDKEMSYIAESLNNDISYCEIKECTCFHKHT